jgi:hypothetical protein
MPMTKHVRLIAFPVSILLALFYAFWIPYLATSLPAHYRVTHWAATWVGLDLFELGLILLTVWFLGRRSRYCAITSAMLAGVMLCDAWFDNLTAHGADITGARLGLIPELGIAVASSLLAVTYMT